MIKVLLLSLVHSLTGTNVSRVGDAFKDKADLSGLAGELANGYDPSKGLIKIRELSPDEITQAMTERESMLKTLSDATDSYDVPMRVGERDKVSVPAAEVLRAWTTLFVDAKGHIKAPKYGVVSGHRRTSVMPLAQAARRIAGLPTESEIPFDIREYTSTLGWNADCVQENMLAIAGRRALGTADKVAAAVHLYEHAGRESDLVKIGYKRGSAQKLFSFCRLNAAFPDEKILDRVIDGQIDFNGLDKEIMRSIAASGDIQALKDYLNKPKANAPKVASGKEIRTYAEQNPVIVVKYVLNAVLANDMGRVNALIPHTKPLNEFWKSLNVGLEPEKDEDQAL